MCGFCGYIDFKKNIENEKIINEMNTCLRKRGPNAENTYTHKNISLGHTRLSIIDVKYGNQPMTKDYNEANYTIVYNGELYNADELRESLTKKGYTFNTKCDTEVVLLSFIEYGKKCLNYLNGIFAFCIYNDKTNDVFLARDRLGVKPLFYFQNENVFVFASEIKGILKHPEVTPILDRDGIKELFALRTCTYTRKYIL